MTKLCWLDMTADAAALRDEVMRDAVRAEAIQQRIDAIVSDSVADLASLPTGVGRVLMAGAGGLPEEIDGVDVVILDSPGADSPDDLSALADRYPGVAFGRMVDVVDAASLDVACDLARHQTWTVLNFRESTRIPLEIVLAAAAKAKGKTITIVPDAQEAAIVLGVLQHGPAGVMMAPKQVGDATRLKAAALPHTLALRLVELTITGLRHVGMGDRACVDTCTYLEPDEGILVGSTANAMVLMVSETHALPYMPTRPFRVNAGALMSYTVCPDERTQYLSELHAGSVVLAVGADGRTRPVTVGRTKIETRPLLAIDAVGPEGQSANVIVQDDWHVRILAPGGVVVNSTTLRPGDRVLGYLPTQARHVGYAIDEFLREQ